MVRLIDLIRGGANRLRKFGQKIINGVRTGAQTVGNAARTAYDITRTRIVPTITNVYHQGRRFLGRINRIVEAGSDAAGDIADAVGGRAGNVIRRGKEQFDRKYGEVRGKVEDIHKKGEDIYNRGRRVYDIGRNLVNTIKQ